jgi:phage host-nuclease inhibitor protein Gam
MADLIQIGIDVNTNIKQATADLDKMGGSVVNNIRTIDRLESEVKQLNNALSKGSATEAAYAKGMRQINNELSVFQQRASKAAKVEKRFGTAAATGGKSMNRFNVALQQGGFQLQDFAVQLQSGTSFFTAFGQQGSQFAGIFGPQGAVIGAIIAVGSALGGMAAKTLMAGKELRDYEEIVKDTTDALEELTKATSAASMSNKELEESFGSASVEIKGTLALLRDIAKNEAQRAIDSLSDSLVELYQVAGDGEKRLGIAEFFDVNIMMAFTRSGKQAVKEARLLTGEFLGAQNALAASKGNLEGQIDATQRLLNSAETLADLDGERNQEEEELIKKLGESLLKMQEAQTVKTKTLSTHRDILGTEEGLALETEALNKLFEDRLGTIDDTANLYEDILGSSKGLSQAEEALNKFYEDRLGTIDDTANEYVDVLGSEKGLSAAVVGTNKFYESRLGTIDDTANEYVDVLGTEEGLGKSVDALNQMYQDRLDKLQAMADAYDDILGSEKGLAEAEAARLALTQVGDSGYAGGRGGDPRDFTNLDEFRRQLKDVTKETKNLKKGMTDAERAAEKLRQELEAPMVKAIDSVSNAFGDFIADGLKDFKSFAKSIVGSFKSMISQMIATAARNKIMLSLGMGGSGFAASAAAGNVAGVGGNAAFGPIGSFMGSFAGGGAAGTGLLGGLGTGISAFGGGIGAGFGASFGSLGTLLSGGSTVAAGGAGFAATLGAAIPAIAAVAVVVGLLSKKTKLLDSGLRTTIEGFDVAIETFKTTQSSRLFGLLKSRAKTGYEAASAEVADPLIEAIGNMQQSIVDAAGTLGIGASAFDDFSYQFKLSLKGLTEEQQLEKINEEINKMGDSFASLTGHFETMNELLEAANQRMQLQNRLDQLLGNNQAILTRQREAELSAMHELNRPLAQMVYNLEDAQASVQSAFASLGASIEAEKNRLRDAFTSIVDGLNKRLDVANETMARSNSIYSMLESAVSGRSITSGIGQSLSRREGALGFIRGGDFSDERKLEEALDVVAEPSEGLFSSFVDYARDFSRTSITLEEAKKVAQVQLTADEKSVLLLEEQIAQAQVDLDAQLEALDKQYQMQVDQYNALLGIDTNVKSVEEAIGTLRSAIEALASAQAAAKAAAAVGTAGAGTGAAAAGIKLTGEKYQGYDLGNIRGAADLMAAAAQNNIQTSGQTGAQIQQALSNATGLAINMDNATRGKQFAMGGYHTGGLRMVGERGPELEATGPSRIFSHNQTSGMFKDPDLKEAVNELRREVSGLRSEQRQMQASNAKYVKRNYDINRKWDVDGLPATRT